MSNLGQIVRLWAFSTFLILCANESNAQEFKSVTKVTEDTVWIKWLPTDYNAMLKLKNGAVINRIEVSSDINLAAQNFEAGKQWEIVPLNERFDVLNRQDSVQDRMATLIEPIISPVAEDAQNFAFGSALIENITQPLFQVELGNYLADVSFDRQKKYAYKVKIEGAEPFYIFVDPSQPTKFSKPLVQLELDQKKTVVCSWNLSKIRNESFAFDVEHSVSNTKNPERLFKEPYLPFKSEFEENQDEAEIRHEQPEKGKMHYYRVIGRDAFGSPALASDWQQIYVPNRIEAYPVIDSVQADLDLRHIHVSSPGFSGASENYKLLRSRKRDSDYETLKATRISFDGEPHRSLFSVYMDEVSGDAYYYKVALMNEDDTVYSQPYYFFTLDQEAPDAPSGLKVEIDSNGIARLDWEELNDSGLLGYRVFRGNSLKEEFVERTNTLSLSTLWIDTLALDNLTPEIYYYIQGVDANYNQGAHSDTIMGIKPDTIPPVSGLIRKIAMVEAGIALEITPSTSTDAVSNILYRGKVSLGEVGEKYLDSTLVPGQFYSYYIVTEDRSGNSSKSKVVSQKYEPGYRAAPTGSIRANFQENYVEINYELPELEIYAVQVYRSKKGEPARRWRTIHDLEQSSIQDRSIRIGETYLYQVKYVTKEGIHSLPLELEVSF